MPISIEDYQEPKFIKYKTRYPLSENSNDRFYKFETNPRSYRDGVFKQEGYNPKHNLTRVEQININSDDITARGDNSRQMGLKKFRKTRAEDEEYLNLSVVCHNYNKAAMKYIKGEHRSVLLEYNYSKLLDK